MKNEIIISIKYSNQEYVHELLRLMNSFVLETPNEFQYQTIYNHIDEQTSDSK